MAYAYDINIKNIIRLGTQLNITFIIYSSEVFRALNKTRGLYLRWQEVTRTPIVHSPEAEWTSTELKNAIRSIEWDLEDLEDTINILFSIHIRLDAFIK